MPPIYKNGSVKLNMIRLTEVKIPMGLAPYPTYFFDEKASKKPRENLFGYFHIKVTEP